MRIRTVKGILCYEALNNCMVKLTRKQIENSPSIESHKSVSRQYEEEYYRYYGWPTYWQGDALWGMSGYPIVDLTAKPLPGKSGTASGAHSEGADVHLRSAQAVNGYNVQTSDGILGHVCDFMMDAESWAVGQLVVKTGHRISGNEVLIPTKQVDRISYEKSTVYVTLTPEAIEQSSAHALAPVEAVA